MENEILNQCPICKSQAWVIRVVDLYFALQGYKPEVLSKFSLSKTKKADLHKFLTPPIVERQPIWHILHPDILFGTVVSVLAVLTIFLFWDNRPWINNLYLVGLLAVTYLLLRKRLVSTFKNNQLMRSNLREEAARKADLWSSAFYCDQDGIVFIPDDNKTFTMSEFSSQLHFN
ncbi:MAG: hypothetical protein HGB14_03940 [Anaerolineaceae bacterium]|nr:hypothetical protein [Anaerolineaceae bacterium]